MAETRKSFGDDVRAAEKPSSFAKRCFAPLLRLKTLFSLKHRAAPLFSADALASLYSVGARDDGDVSLGFLLRQSAHSIERGRALIAARGAELSRLIAAQTASEASLAAWAARLLIALFWAFAGVVLVREASAGSPVRGLAAADAAMLARVFVAVGVLGAAAAFVGGFLARAAAKNAGAGGDLGAEAGRIARDFGETVAEIRARIGSESGGAAAGEFSRLHLVALEAASFFEAIGFLAEADEARAAEKFRAFLAGCSAPSSSGVPGLLLLALGAAIGVGAAGGAPSFGAASGLPLWAVLALPGLAFLYAGMGVLFSAAGASASGTAAAQAREEMLTALRRSYVAAGAPKANALFSEVEAALADFRARIGADGRAHSGRAGDSNVDDPAWRKPAEGPRVVPRAFEALPPLFRADAQAPPAKIFSARGRRNAEPKQTASAPDAPPWLND